MSKGLGIVLAYDEHSGKHLDFSPFESPSTSCLLKESNGSYPMGKIKWTDYSNTGNKDKKYNRISIPLTRKLRPW